MIRLVDVGLAPAIVWLVTYLAHSTVWVAGAWLLGRRLALAPRARSWMWRMAIVGPLLTGALQVAMGGAWTVGSVRLAEPAPAEPVVFEYAPLTNGSSPSPTPERIDWTTAALFGLASLALLRLGVLGRRAWRLRRELGARRLVTDLRLQRTFAHLLAGLERRVAARLTESERLSSPVALGAAEVCLPARARSLDDAALAAVLGHELAHLERRDNLWLLVGAVVEAVFFLQPLNRLARRRLQESAELASDERAVELTDDPMGLARSLAEVATWGFGSDAGLLASPVVSGPGALLHRVRSLLERDGRRQSRWLGPLLVGALAAFALALPSFGEAEVQAAIVVPVVAPPVFALVDPSRVVPPPTRPTPPAPPALAPVAPVAPVAPRPRRWMEHDHGSAFVLVKDGKATATSASAAEVQEALALKSELEGEYLWVRRHDRKVAITDAASIAKLRPMLDEQRGLREREASIETTMAELGKRQAELGQKQAEMGTKHAALGMKSAELGVRRAELDVRRMDMKLKARAGAFLRLSKGGANESAASPKEAAELARIESDIEAKRQELARMQRELGQQHGELGRQQGELGRQQGDLGRQQGDLGRRMGELVRDRVRLQMRFSGELDGVVDEQIGAGKARVLAPGR